MDNVIDFNSRKRKSDEETRLDDLHKVLEEKLKTLAEMRERIDTLNFHLHQEEEGFVISEEVFERLGGYDAEIQVMLLAIKSKHYLSDLFT